jgi:hypothetical protein
MYGVRSKDNIISFEDDEESITVPIKNKDV